jgi:hypothetical protein
MLLLDGPGRARENPVFVTSAEGGVEPWTEILFRE